MKLLTHSQTSKVLTTFNHAGGSLNLCKGQHQEYPNNHVFSIFTPQPKLGSRGIVVIRRAGGRAGVATSPLPLSRAQLLSDRGQTW